MSSEIRVTITPSFDKLGQAFSKIGLDKFMREQTLKFAFLTERFAKQIVPVKTGALKTSIGVSSLISPIGAIAQTNINYAVFVHEGTRFMRGRPFMEKGADFAKRNWDGQIGSRLDRHLRLKLKKL